LKYKIKFTLFIFLFAFIYSPKVYAEVMPEIVGKAGITIDVAMGEMIYTKNIDERLFPASTTKLMTAIILAENSKPEDIFTYSKNAKAEEPFTISFNVKNIAVNDKITASDAMDAMLLPSANDIAYMIGENVSKGNYKAFIELMNKKVKQLNLKNTHFVTANGLHDQNHYSSAYDLSVIAREASKYPWITNTLLKREGQIKSLNGVIATFKNKNKLLLETGCIGGKTGYTSQAGRCLVSYFEIGGRKLVGIVLKSDYDNYDKAVFEDMKRIINWSYNAEKETLIKENSEVKNISKKYFLLPYNIGPVKSVDIALHTKEDVQRYISSDLYRASYSYDYIDPFKLDKDTAIGSVTITSRETKRTYSLYPSINRKDIINANRSFYIIFFSFILTSVAFIIVLIMSITQRKYKKLLEASS